MCEFIKFIYCIFLDDDIFNIIVNTYIGLSALIIALVIFIMDKGNAGKRKIFRTTLIKESNIAQLMRKTIFCFCLIFLQVILPSNLLICIYRIVLYIYIFNTASLIYESFKRVFNILSDEYEKQEAIAKTLHNNIEKYEKKTIESKKMRENSRKEIEKKFSDKDYISFDEKNMCWDKDKYIFKPSNESGKIKKINYDKLKVLNDKIKSFIFNNKVEIENNKEVCVLLKLEGETVTKNEYLFCIDKKLEKLNIDCSSFFKVVKEDNIAEQIIENEISDICEELVNNINSNNIYGQEKSCKELIELYKLFCGIWSKSLHYGLQKFECKVMDIYKHYSKKRKNLIKNLFFNLFYIAQQHDIYKDFQEYYNTFISLEKTEKDVDIFRELSIEKNRINGIENIKNKNLYMQYILEIKQCLYKELVDSNNFDKILEKIGKDEYTKINKLNSVFTTYFRYERNPEKYLNFDLNNEKEQLKNKYNNMIEEKIINDIPIINIAEWARYKYNKNKDERLIEFAKKLIDIFEYYNTDDIIELYMEIRKNQCNLLNKIAFWELVEPENRGKSISLKTNINYIIIIIFLKSSIGNKDKIKFRGYINKDNVSQFMSFKRDIEKIPPIELEMFNINADKKQKVLLYLDDVIYLCTEEKQKAIRNFELTEEQKKMFESYCIKSLNIERKKSKLFDFFKEIKKIKYNDKNTGKFFGYNLAINKDYFWNDVDREIKELAKSLSENLVNEQMVKLSESISKNANSTSSDLHAIIEKFEIKDNLYILTPYITEELDTWDAKSNQYVYQFEENGRKIKIPVRECFIARDELIISSVDSLGTIEFIKLEDNKYTIASIDNIQDKAEKYSVKLLQNVQYIKSKNNAIFKIEI